MSFPLWGVHAAVGRLAPFQATAALHHAANDAVLLYGKDHIFRAGGLVAAAVSDAFRGKALIYAHQKDADPLEKQQQNEKQHPDARPNGECSPLPKRIRKSAHSCRKQQRGKHEKGGAQGMERGARELSLIINGGGILLLLFTVQRHQLLPGRRALKGRGGRILVLQELHFLGEDEHIDVMLGHEGLLIEDTSRLGGLGGHDGLQRMELPSVGCVCVDELCEEVGCHRNVVVLDADHLGSGYCLVDHGMCSFKLILCYGVAWINYTYLFLKSQ